MTDSDTLKRKPQKFLFDAHNFNDDEEQDIEEESTPPPPTFSEEELEAARQDAYNHGHKDGLAEAEAAREKYIAGLLGEINQNFTALFDHEQKRHERFEQEAVALSQAIFKKLFPEMNHQNGLREIEAVLTRILSEQTDKPEIVIEVHHDYVDDIQAHTDKIRDQIHSSCLYKVEGSDALAPGDCRLRWAHGGAYRDSNALAQQIEKELQLVLADTLLVRDNENNQPDAGSEKAEADTETEIEND